MKTVNQELLKEQIKITKDAALMAQKMKQEVMDFYESFEDDPQKHSQWGHHYFCKEDGHVLDYNPQKPNHHICPICKRDYSSPLLDGVWICIYRNEAALTILKASILYLITEEEQYLTIVMSLAGFYLQSFEQFKLHNKEGEFFDSLDHMKWGCGRIMPQSLNESIFFIRIFTALELVKEKLPKEWTDYIINDFSKAIFRLLSPQVDKIHNISCWMNSAIGIIGLFCNDKRMIQFAFEGTYNINRQLREGVTEDGFWYEGSIHYNFFTLEGIAYLALFAGMYEKEFTEVKTIEKMLKAAYHYAFSNQILPNPNDGWPNINLKTYSYIYAIGTKVFGHTSESGKILGTILSADYERGEIPLSKPYYYNNKLSLEQLLLLPDFKPKALASPNNRSMDFEQSNYALLKEEKVNVFYKYGHHGPSHAHPDKMTIEVMFKERSLTRDLSNSGYGSVICNEWHRTTAAHNTVVVDGKNHTSVDPGKKLSFKSSRCNATAASVYEDVDFRREIQITENGFSDEFQVISQKERTYDFIFHVEAEPDMDLEELFETERVESLGFSENGYPYFKNIIRIKPKIILKDDVNFDAGFTQKKVKMLWKLGELSLTSEMEAENTQIFLAKSPSNPVTDWRTSIILRRVGKETTFNMAWSISDRKRRTKS